MRDWWKTFFDDGYLRIWGQMFSEEADAKQAAELWSMLDLGPGCQLLDAPCGWSLTSPGSPRPCLERKDKDGGTQLVG